MTGANIKDDPKGYSAILLFAVAALFFVSFVLFSPPTPAHAAGWWKESGTDTANLSVSNGVTGSAEVLWSAAEGNQGYTSPHGGFTTTSNLCKTCHAIHGAGQSSYRLLKSGNTTETRTTGEDFGVAGMGSSRANECMYCHDANSGASSKRPYELGVTPGAVVRGEHTLGASEIPDSSVNGGGLGRGNLPDRGGPYADGRQALVCYSCHTVHGANDIGHDGDHDGELDPLGSGATYDANDAVERWNSKILRVDPAGDGSVLATGLQGTLSAAQWTAQLGVSTEDGGALAVRTGFCVDCHNKNPNWSLTTDDADRPNKTSHPQGPGADSMVEAYGESVQVAAHPIEKQGCRGCHFATDNDSRPGPSRFPHQTTGYKLLYDEATQDQLASDTGSPFREVPRLDRICLSCHRVGQEPMGGYEEEEEVACLECHDSKYGAPDVGDEIRKDSSHPIATFSGRHREGTQEGPQAFAAPSNRHAECPDCHKAQAVYPWSDTPLTGIWGVGVINGAAGTTPDYTVKTEVTYQYELCFKCHSSYTTQPNSSVYFTADPPSEATRAKQGDKSLEFNPNNSAYHPVEAAGRNVSSNLAQQLAPNGLGTGDTIRCTDCHNSEGASDVQGLTSNSSYKPKGPHGSENNTRLPAPNNLVLRAFYWTGYRGVGVSIDPVWSLPPWTTTIADNAALCFKCHDYTKLMAFKWWGDGARTNFYQGNLATATLAEPEDYARGNLHNWHLVEARDVDGIPITCRSCHFNIHSNVKPPNTRYRQNSTGVYVTTSEPPLGVKTHLINFSPYVRPRPADDPIAPRWSINMLSRWRQCSLVCHFDADAARTGELNQWHSPATYRPPAGDDSMTYDVTP